MEESFSRRVEKPLREVPVLSSRAHLGAQKRAVPCRNGINHDPCILVRGGGNIGMPVYLYIHCTELWGGWGEGGGGAEGIKRWGIEGIRIGTSDRFGRGRGELRGIG